MNPVSCLLQSTRDLVQGNLVQDRECQEMSLRCLKITASDVDCMHHDKKMNKNDEKCSVVDL